jgi:hypothetical protein
MHSSRYAIIMWGLSEKTSDAAKMDILSRQFRYSRTRRRVLRTRVELDALAVDPAVQAHYLGLGFFARGLAALSPAPPAFRLACVSPDSTAIGSHPGMPCRMRSAFLAGVMWP